MILTHPFLFNTIVVLFIAFTSGWLFSVISGGKTTKLKARIRELENEKRKMWKCEKCGNVKMWKCENVRNVEM